MTTKKIFQARQGDLFIEEVKNLPAKLRKRKSNVILFGEATGHSHRLSFGDVYDSVDGRIFLDVPKATDIVHDEHKSIRLSKGLYAVTRQTEYVMKDMVRVVVD